VDHTTRANRSIWETAPLKHVREYEKLLDLAAAGSSLIDAERHLLHDILEQGPDVVHLQSGHGLEDVALVHAGARSVVGVDFSAVAADAAQRRATEIGVTCRYVVSVVPDVPLADASADLVCTGKGALIWMQDLLAWGQIVTTVVEGRDGDPAPW
jgi:ubiquinone/menaquinone biosynthesis C-methylase UbiE